MRWNDDVRSEAVAHFRIHPILRVVAAEQPDRRALEDVGADGQPPVAFEGPDDFRAEQPVGAVQIIGSISPCAFAR